MGKIRDEFAETVRRRLAELNLSARGAAMKAGMPLRSIHGVIEGHAPTIDRVAEICDALGLEFYAGPPRKPPMPWAESDADGAPRERRGGPVPRAPPLAAVGVIGDAAAPPARVAAADEEDLPGGFAPDGRVYFSDVFLSRWGLDPERCLMLGMEDDAMAPTLPSGCSALGDMRRAQRVSGSIYVLFDGDRLSVRRAEQDEGGDWRLICDNPDWPDEPWPPRTRIVAQVVWSAQVLL